MVPPTSTTGRASGRGRRPEDAPALAAVSSVPSPAVVSAGLPEALAAAVLGNQAPPAAVSKTPAARTAGPAPEPVQDVGAAEASAATSPETAKEAALVAVESRSAAEADRAIRWLGVTFRPPDVWRERQPSLREEWEFVLDGSHLPEQGLWRAAARGYAAPAIGLITLLHFLIWVLRSPARHATAWVVVALVAGSAHLML